MRGFIDSATARPARRNQGPHLVPGAICYLRRRLIASRRSNSAGHSASYHLLLPFLCRRLAVSLGPAEGEAGEAAHTAAGGDIQGEGWQQPVVFARSVAVLWGCLIGSHIVAQILGLSEARFSGTSGAHQAHAARTSPTPPHRQTPLSCARHTSAGRRRRRGL